MAGIPDSITIDITCPGCEKKSSQGLAQLHRDPKFTCPACGATIRVEGDGLEKINAASLEIEKTLADLGKSASIKFRF